MSHVFEPMAIPTKHIIDEHYHIMIDSTTRMVNVERTLMLILSYHARLKTKHHWGLGTNPWSHDLGCEGQV